MSELKKLSTISIEEFEAMEKQNDITYELIDGIVMMSPKPAKPHQRTCGRVYAAMLNLLDGKNCEPIQEIDVVLDGNVLSPDIMVICNDDNPNSKRQETPPLIVVEVLSPTSMSRDNFTKRIKYEQLGIAEYWIVAPSDKCILVISYTTDEQETYCEGIAKSFVMPELQIELDKIFTI